ncbi:MAG: hypothetical protein ACOCXN_06395 [Spirochaetota bacterium]
MNDLVADFGALTPTLLVPRAMLGRAALLGIARRQEIVSPAAFAHRLRPPAFERKSHPDSLPRARAELEEDA